MSAKIGETMYFAFPTLPSAVGENGIYRKTKVVGDLYGWYDDIADLSDPTVKAEYQAQREAVYTYSIQSEDGAVRNTCALIAHQEYLFLLTSQADETAQSADEAAALIITMIDPTSGEVLATVPLGSYQLQPDYPPMFYQNQGYLSVAVAEPEVYTVRGLSMQYAKTRGVANVAF